MIEREESNNRGLTKDEIEIRDKLISLGFIKLVYEPCNEIPEAEWECYVKPFNFSNEPVYLYYSYKDSRKNKFKLDKWVIGNWQFKCFLLTSKLNIYNLFLLDDYPQLKNLFMFDSIGFSLNCIRKELKKIAYFEYYQTCKDLNCLPNNQSLEVYQNDAIETYGLGKLK